MRSRSVNDKIVGICWLLRSLLILQLLRPTRCEMATCHLNGSYKSINEDLARKLA